MSLTFFRIVLMWFTVCLAFSVSETFAQCGADGNQPCNPAPKKTAPKRTATSSVSKPATPTKKKPASVSKTQPKVVSRTSPPSKSPVETLTTPFKIISKPRPSYTDAARQNQVTGIVRLKVTFLASGAVGSIAPVSGLPYGLTEQAIAAARQIKFEPQKKNGTAVDVTKIIEYNFQTE